MCHNAARFPAAYPIQPAVSDRDWARAACHASQSHPRFSGAHVCHPHRALCCQMAILAQPETGKMPISWSLDCMLQSCVHACRWWKQCRWTVSSLHTFKCMHLTSKCSVALHPFKCIHVTSRCSVALHPFKCMHVTSKCSVALHPWPTSITIASFALQLRLGTCSHTDLYTCFSVMSQQHQHLHTGTSRQQRELQPSAASSGCYLAQSRWASFRHWWHSLACLQKDSLACSCLQAVLYDLGNGGPHQ